MSRTSLILLVAGLLVLGALAAQADEPRPTDLNSQRIAEIKNLIAVERAALAELQDRIERAPDQAAELDLIKRIGELKRNTEIGILEIQLRYARIEGLAEAAARLETAIDELRAPPPRGVPQPRPAPDAARR